MGLLFGACEVDLVSMPVIFKSQKSHANFSVLRVSKRNYNFIVHITVTNLRTRTLLPSPVPRDFTHTQKRRCELKRREMMVKLITLVLICLSVFAVVSTREFLKLIFNVFFIVS